MNITNSLLLNTVKKDTHSTRIKYRKQTECKQIEGKTKRYITNLCGPRKGRTHFRAETSSGDLSSSPEVVPVLLLRRQRFKTLNFLGL